MNHLLRVSNKNTANLGDHCFKLSALRSGVQIYFKLLMHSLIFPSNKPNESSSKPILSSSQIKINMSYPSIHGIIKRGIKW